MASTISLSIAKDNNQFKISEVKVENATAKTGEPEKTADKPSPSAEIKKAETKETLIWNFLQEIEPYILLQKLLHLNYPNINDDLYKVSIETEPQEKNEICLTRDELFMFANLFRNKFTNVATRFKIDFLTFSTLNDKDHLLDGRGSSNDNSFIPLNLVSNIEIMWAKKKSELEYEIKFGCFRITKGLSTECFATWYFLTMPVKDFMKGIVVKQSQNKFGTLSRPDMMKEPFFNKLCEANGIKYVNKYGRVAFYPPKKFDYVSASSERLLCSIIMGLLH